jgi:phosphatidylglycerophosphatase A
MIDRKKLTAAQRGQLLASPAGWIACGLGSGLAPVAQGTFGSLAAIIPWLGLRSLPLPLYVLVLALAFALGVWACGEAGRALGVADHRSLVWDEFVGQWLTLLPLLWVPGPWWLVVVGFALFRLFDVWKPWPIGWLDRHLKGGLGVMADDALAGAVAAVLLALLVLALH